MSLFVVFVFGDFLPTSLVCTKMGGKEINRYCVISSTLIDCILHLLVDELSVFFSFCFGNIMVTEIVVSAQYLN